MSNHIFFKKKFLRINSGDSPTPADPVINYTEEYLTFEALEDGFSIGGLEYSNTTTTYYKINNGSWTIYNPSYSITLNAGETVKFSANATDLNWAFAINGSEKFKVYGNIMSVVYGDNTHSVNNFRNKTTYPANATYPIGAMWFFNNTGLISAKKLILPATTLIEANYQSMFQGCTSLVDAPEILPATTLTESCYECMFQDCTSLVTAPELPATTLAPYCYQNMFMCCSSLVTAPELPATTLADSCYYGMFGTYSNRPGCVSLTTAPELPATTLAPHCYHGMFQGCTKITNNIELPATVLADYCYANMFSYGSYIITELPATVLTEGCYSGMFRYVYIETAPELPAITLKPACYREMFAGNTSLRHVKMMASQGLSEQNCFLNWIDSGVEHNNSCTFTKKSGVALPYGVIPSGWSVKNI